MIATLALAAALVGAPPPSWIGADKVKHFLLSAFAHSVAYSAARAVGMQRTSSQIVGGASVVLVGTWKELHDRRAKRPFSAADLVWDAAGGLAAAALMNGTR